jgi:hypothetical protein
MKRKRSKIQNKIKEETAKKAVDNCEKRRMRPMATIIRTT